jgi:enamine deaminase RidA (YjgF/YER057c/UK114 family)
MWPVGGKVVSFEEAKAAAKPLDRDFFDMVAEKSGGGNGSRRLVAALSDETTAAMLLPDDFAAQTKMVMKNLTKALAAGGAQLSDVTKVTIYICNPHDVPKARSILYDYFDKHPPASTLCILRGLANPDFLLEIEAIAAV